LKPLRRSDGRLGWRRLRRHPRFGRHRRSVGGTCGGCHHPRGQHHACRTM